MAEDSDQDSKTEDPTSKRVQDARNKGQVTSSREVGTALLLLAATGTFYFQGESLWLSMQNKMRLFFAGFINDGIQPQGVVVLIQDMIVSMLLDLMPLFLLFLIVSILGSIMQHGMLFTFDPLMPKFSKINPIQGMARLFSMRSIVELFKSIIKISVISIAVYLALKGSALEILGLSDTNLGNVVRVLGADVMHLLILVTIAFTALAVIDYAYQHHEYVKNLRMTKQEVKDEQKQMEGDPLVKGRIRQIQREMAQRRMMEEVPKADVVITNPTHYAAALLYKQGEMMAPKLVAKGRGRIAERIREIARENKIVLVENPPLARSLYSEVPLDAIIPPQLFKAVAQVLAYVYSLRRSRY
ncbi:MAG: flagellar biosynthesis protein FlhB [Magnetococcales bacterium]|nr:flagellar biosynthesis protein FlhB [Magnetococcales bacterium]MBF0149283.1 flagellar biosynthesis protein FlhB [Magnetococcales bacterium]MBF0172816.1 flagellar biosynthesis protein FlhB [Magnetococcales bacterium]MBF0631615.1 flagellar biosynthesis protein FlhB [Magnetococcales bacterium]